MRHVLSFSILMIHAAICHANALPNEAMFQRMNSIGLTSNALSVLDLDASVAGDLCNWAASAEAAFNALDAARQALTEARQDERVALAGLDPDELDAHRATLSAAKQTVADARVALQDAALAAIDVDPNAETRSILDKAGSPTVLLDAQFADDVTRKAVSGRFILLAMVTVDAAANPRSLLADAVSDVAPSMRAAFDQRVQRAVAIEAVLRACGDRP